jgi:Domain of unknown function (DUF4383)
MAKQVAVVFGIVMLVIGILGFGPAVNTAGPSGTSYTLLLGIFAINPLHNVIHLATGAIALAAGLYGSGAYARIYFLVFGIVYALITLIGVTGILFDSHGSLLGIVPINGADNVLHLAIMIVSLGTYALTSDRQGVAMAR